MRYYYRLIKEWGKDGDYYFLGRTNVPRNESDIKNKLERAAHTLLAQMEGPDKEVTRVRVEYNFGTKKIRRL